MICCGTIFIGCVSTVLVAVMLLVSMELVEPMMLAPCSDVDCIYTTRLLNAASWLAALSSAMSILYCCMHFITLARQPSAMLLH